MITRKWHVRLHMKSGKTLTLRCNECTWRTDNNKLTRLAYPGAYILDYINLDEIEAITSRRCLLHWRFK